MQMMSCLVMPLSSSVVCQEERSSVARAGSAARLQQSSDWPTGPPFQTRVTSPGKQPLLHAAPNRGTVVEDITAAMLSSPNPWPCHSRQARWRRVAKMFVNFCGYMILYVCVYMCERARAWRGRQHDAVASYESVQFERISTASKLFFSG